MMPIEHIDMFVHVLLPLFATLKIWKFEQDGIYYGQNFVHIFDLERYMPYYFQNVLGKPRRKLKHKPVENLLFLEFYGVSN